MGAVRVLRALSYSQGCRASAASRYPSAPPGERLRAPAVAGLTHLDDLIVVADIEHHPQGALNAYSATGISWLARRGGRWWGSGYDHVLAFRRLNQPPADTDRPGAFGLANRLLEVVRGRVTALLRPKTTRVRYLETSNHPIASSRAIGIPRRRSPTPRRG